jgi:hypothetical protein
MTSEKELYSGIMIDGTFEADVPDDIANLPDWKNPIFIGVGSAKHGKNEQVFNTRFRMSRRLIHALNLSWQFLSYC